MISCVHAKSATGKRVPQKTLVGSVEAIDVRLDPSVTGGQDYAICSARLRCSVHREMTHKSGCMAAEVEHPRTNGGIQRSLR